MKKENVIKFLFGLINRIWIWYSNYFWINIKKSIPIHECDTKLDNNNFDDNVLSLLQETISEKFVYTYDLIDNVLPPFVAYDKYKSGKLREDCDGYHACIYHIFHNNMSECQIEDVRLFTLNPYDKPTSGHCIFAYKRNGLWTLIDYDQVYTYGFTSLYECGKKYYTDVYRVTYVPSDNTDVHFCSYRYDYNNKKWKVK